MRNKAYHYVLGDSAREAARLRRQAKLWDPVTFALFDQLGIKKGSKVLEIGPGQGSVFAELVRRTGGACDAVERSPVFARHIRKLAPQSAVHCCNLLDAELPDNSYDFIFARWVFIFLPDPVGHLVKLRRALRRNGKLVLQEYHRSSFDMEPRPKYWREFCAADAKLFASQGGDISIGSKLPRLLRSADLRCVNIEPHLKVGAPRSQVWNWLSDYFLPMMQRLSELGPLSLTKAESLRKAWLAAANNPDSLIIAPALVSIVAQKTS